MTGTGDARGPERVAEAAQAEGLTLAGCPTRCDSDCYADCHEAHSPPAYRWHEPGWSCAEVQLAIARAVAAERDRRPPEPPRRDMASTVAARIDSPLSRPPSRQFGIGFGKEVIA
jgi:hypothetical protein